VKPYTRKDFIRLSAAAGAALYLNACGIGADTDKKDEKAQQSAPEPRRAGSLLKAGSFEKVVKGDARYDALRKGFNKRIDKYPAIIAPCTTTGEVAAAVQYAHEHKLAIAVKSGGHSMEGFSCNDGGMVINLSGMNKVAMLADNKISVGPGCTLSHLYDALLPEGRILPAGSCATVGVGGLALGGGYGLFARRYGLTCDHLVEATMVDGKGAVHTTRDNEELLWALRGGGTGNFGIVTEMVFCTQAAPPTLQAHYFKARKLTAERAAAILKTWMELAPSLPDSCFSGYVLNGATLNILITNYDPDNTALPPLLDKLAAVTDEFRSSRVGTLPRMLHKYYGVGKPVAFRNSSAGLFHDYSDLAGFIAQIFEKIVATPGMIYQVNTLGGKIKDAAFEKLSCYPHRTFDFISELQAYWTTDAQAARLETVTHDVLALTRQQGIRQQYVNYCSLEFGDWETAYYGSNYARLQAIKRRYDPDNNIRHSQSIKA
jgi:hypothetical protein